MNNTLLKRCICSVLSIIMIFSSIFADGAVLHAFAEESKKKLYKYDNFDIEYLIGSEWDGAQSVNVKITNTGEESILNWYLKYNAGGTIENLYNAIIFSDSETGCVIKNNGYNYEIEPNSTVEFGYILRGESLNFPKDFDLCTKRIKKKTGFNVDFKVTSEWDKGFNGEIVITNISDKPIEAWTLAFDSNFEINNYWNCKLLSNSNGKYTFANKLWTTPIAVGSSASFGFSAALINGEKPYAKNWSLTEVVVDISEETDETEFNLIGFAEYSKESDAIVISWITEYENGSFEILSSDNGNDFESVANVKDTYSYEYKITEPFSKRYFKIRQTLDSGHTGESNVLLLCKDGDGYSMEFQDTDNDEVPDYLEKAFGLDINKADTDDDGLTDYEEMFLTGTDPTVYDSVKKGMADADADSDSDGLSNKKEIELGTDPIFADTDKDGLSDGDEVNKYHTDPLKADTDGDGISDGDEIAMGLDPLNPTTYGVPDSEYTFDVDLSEDSEAMSEINNDNSYKLSIEIKAAGNIENNIDVRESDYSETIKSPAIVGKSFDIEYDTSCKTEKIVLKFDLNKEIINDSESDIERFCVFKLFEDYNIILPVYTEYNSDDSLVYAQVDELGTYCLMDMEKLMESVSDNDSENAEDIAMLSSENKPVVYANSSNVSWQNSIDKSAINVAFVMDIRNNIDRETFDAIKSNVIKAASEVLKESPSAKIYLILQHYDKESRDNLGYTVIEDDDEAYFTDSVKIFDEIDYLHTYSVDKYHNYCVLSDAVKYVFDNCDNSKGTYFFSIFDSNDVVYRTSLVGEDIIGVTDSDDYGYEVLNKLAENKIDVSIISNIPPEYNLGYAIDLYKTTGGIYIDGLSGFSDEVLMHIYGYIPNHEKKSTAFYNGLNFEEMKLDSEVTKEYLSVAEELGTKMQEILTSDDRSALTEIRNAYSDYADSDNDFVYDFEEVDIFNSLIDWSDDGSIILPTIEDYCDIIGDKKVTKAMKEYIEENWDPLLTISIMPIVSDPTKPDTDDDGFVDYYEVLYNEKRCVSTYSNKSDLDDNSLFYLNPICKTEWEARSDMAHFVEIGGYNYDPKQHIIYSKYTPIQRFFGFARTVDLAADPILSSAIFCDPIYFFYDGKEYLLELWKGQYGLMSGTEVGLYYRKPCIADINYTISGAVDGLKHIVFSLEKYDKIDEMVKDKLDKEIDEYLNKDYSLKVLFKSVNYDFNAEEAIKLFKGGISVADYITNIIEGTQLDQISTKTAYDDEEEKWFRSAEIDDTIKVSYTVKTNKFDKDGEPMKDINGNPYIEEHPSDEIEYSVEKDHWWATGFEWGKYTDKEAFIEVKIQIEFDDAAMANAFVSGGDIPYALYKIDKSDKYDELIAMQQFGLAQAIGSSKMNHKSTSTEFTYNGGNIVYITYKNYFITNENQTDSKQVQSYYNKKIIQDVNWEFVKSYKKTKEIVGIPFEFSEDGVTEHILYTNDPNLMTVRDFANGMEESGFWLSKALHAHTVQSINMATLAVNNGGDRLSLAINLVNGSFGLEYGICNQYDTYMSIANSIFRYLDTGIPVTVDFLIMQLKENTMEGIDNRDDILTMIHNYGNRIYDGIGALGTQTYYDKNGNAVYLNELYEQWYERYTAMYGIDTIYTDSQYNYAVNHLMGMAMSLEYITQQINQLKRT